MDMSSLSEPVGPLEYLFSIGQEMEEVSATLLFQGDEIDPDFVSEVLRIAATRSRKKGEGDKPSRAAEVGFWSLRRERVRNRSLEEEIRALFQILPEDQKVWDRLKGFGGSLFCGLWMHHWNRECFLSPDLMAEVARRHLTLRLDVYHEGNDEAGETPVE